MHIGCGCLSIILVVFVIIIGSLAPNDKPNADTSKNSSYSVSDEFVKYENQLKYISSKCDSDYNKAVKSLENREQLAAYKQFESAHYSCLDSFNNYKNLEIPAVLQQEYKKELKGTKEDLSTAYATKSSACKKFQKAIDKNSIEQLNQANDNIDLSNRLSSQASIKLADIKNKIKK